MTVGSIAQIIATTYWISTTLFLLGASSYTCWRSTRRKNSAPTPLPPVTILKPLKGIDPELEANLASFFHIDYPEYELIFCVSSPSDPAIHLVQNLIDRYPDIKSSLVIGGAQLGTNPKVNNLLPALDRAKHDAILISDSYIRATPSLLLDMVASGGLQAGGGGAPVRATGGIGLGGQLEEIHANSYYVRAFLISHIIGVGYLVGSSMIFRRSFAAKFGGFSVLKNYGAEDYAFSLRARQAGKCPVTQYIPVTHYVGQKSVRAFWMRHQRWTSLRKYAALEWFAIEWANFNVLNALVASFIFSDRGVFAALMAFMGSWLISMLQDIAMVTAVKGRFDLRIWVVRDLLLPFIYLHALGSRKITWRGTKLTIRKGGLVEAEEEYLQHTDELKESEQAPKSKVDGFRSAS